MSLLNMTMIVDVFNIKVALQAIWRVYLTLAEAM